MNQFNVHNPASVEKVTGNIDPRLVLILAVATIALLFAQNSWLSLLVVCSFVGGVIFWLNSIRLFIKRILWLRWVLLFTVVLHMVLSPGHTILGFSFITFEGLSRGLMVCTQVVAAMAISLILAQLVATEKLITAVHALLKPLNLFGLNISGVAGQIRLTLRFVPILKDEVAVASKTVVPDNGRSGLSGRIGQLRMIIGPMIHSLVGRADDMAHAAVTDNEDVNRFDSLPSFWPPAMMDIVLLLFFTFMLLVLSVLP